jgi:cell division protein FtsB
LTAEGEGEFHRETKVDLKPKKRCIEKRGSDALQPPKLKSIRKGFCLGFNGGLEQMNKSAANPSSSLEQSVLDSMYRNRRRLATGCAMLVAVALGYFAVAGDNGIAVYKQKRTEDKQLARQIQALKQENAQLQTRIDRLKSDPAAIEHEARETLHYARPGEVIVALPDAPASKQTATPGASTPVPNK